MFTNIQTIIRKHSVLLALCIITFLGAYLRGSQLYTKTYWFGDAGRDVWVAKYLVESQRYFDIVPPAHGGAGALFNSPVYYWIISLFWALTYSEKGVILIFCLVGISLIPFSFAAAKQFTTGWKTVILPLFVAVSHVMISFSHSIWQPHLQPFFQILSTLFLLRGLKKHSLLLLLLAVQSAFLAFHIHLSYAPLLLMTLGIIFVHCVQKRSWKQGVTILCVTLANIFLWLILTSNFLGNRPGITATGILSENISQYCVQLLRNFSVLGLSVFGSHNGWLIIGVFALIIFFLFQSTKNTSITVQQTARLLLVFWSSLLLTGFYGLRTHFHYLAPYHVLFLFSGAFLLARLSKKYTLAALVGTLVFGVCLLRPLSYSVGSHPLDTLASSKKIARIIWRYSNHYSPSIQLCRNDGEHCPLPFLFTDSIWFQLEEISHQRLGYISSSANHVMPIFSQTDTVDYFLICEYTVTDCLNDTHIPSDKTQILFENREITLMLIRPAKQIP